jgi:hypothetical protein
MRSVLSTLLLLTACVLAGCTGGANSTPTALTPDEQRQMDEAEAKANAEEAAQRKNTK